jgi:hypothetical protein
MEMARSRLKDKGLSNTFWADAVSIIVYLRNKCLTKVVTDKILIDAWSGRKPFSKASESFWQ